jgi:hypothetical protein
MLSKQPFCCRKGYAAMSKITPSSWGAKNNRVRRVCAKVRLTVDWPERHEFTAAKA